MKIELSSNTPENVAIAYNESVRILSEVTTEANTGSAKHAKEVNFRKYLGYVLKFVSIVAAILITADYLPHQLAIAIAIIYAIDVTLSNSKRLVAIAQATKAYTAIGRKVARTHQTEQNEIFSLEADKVEAIKKITALNIKLNKEAHAGFTTVETAIDQSDIETLQALSLDEDKLNFALKHIQGNK